jgi:hypothetical protein
MNAIFQLLSAELIDKLKTFNLEEEIFYLNTL